MATALASGCSGTKHGEVAKAPGFGLAPFFLAPRSRAVISIGPKRWLIDMLIFHCSDCNETINSADYESADQIFARLEEHVVTKCFLANFTYDGTTDVARQRVGAWRSVIERERLVGVLRLHWPKA